MLVLGRPEVLFEEVLLGVLLGLHLADDIFREAVGDPATAYLRDSVLRVGTTDVVGPLHLLGLDDHPADLCLAVLGWGERDDEVRALLAIRLEEATLGVNNELRGRVSSEEGCELGVALQVVVQLERDARGLVKRALDHDHVVNLGLEGFKDNVELPAATSALVDHEFGSRLEGPQRLKSHVEGQRLIRAAETILLLLEEHRPVDKAFVLSILDVELVAEGVCRAQVVEAWEHDPQGLVVRFAGPGLEVVVDGRRGALSNTSEGILPDELLAHAHDDRGLALGHCLWREGVWNLQDAQRPNAEIVALQEKREDLGVVGLHVDMDSRGLLEGVLEGQHRRSVVANGS